jgi:hypothetical protein
MMIIDPVALGDVASTRPSSKNVYDKAGTLVTVPANQVAITYDPSDLKKAPYPVIEPSATNVIRSSENLADMAVWAQIGLTVTPNTGIAPDGTVSMDTLNGVAAVTCYVQQTFAVTPQADWGVSIFFSKDTSDSSWIRVFNSGLSVEMAGVIFQWTNGVPSIVATSGAWTKMPTIELGTGGVYRLKGLVNTQANAALNLLVYPSTNNKAENAKFWGAHAQLGEVGTYISTAGAVVTRAADTIAAGAGLVYSNVAITETAYSVAATYAKDAQVYDPATYLMYQSLANANTGKALTDTTAWTPMNRPVNRWQMFDSYNNTQTANAEEIMVVLSPQAISQGVYLGNVDATEVRISVVDLSEGLVYRETQSLVVPDSKSSFYNWCFKRIRRKSYLVSVGLPPYANALITIAIRKPGGIAKCGVCAVGPLVDVGLSQYGLSREIRDFSTINFNFDGTSNQQIRNYAKRMDVDVQIENDVIDSVTENLEAYRQRPVAWIGAKEFGSACVFGRYSSFKNVIKNVPFSLMNLQIEGTV